MDDCGPHKAIRQGLDLQSMCRVSLTLLLSACATVETPPITTDGAGTVLPAPGTRMVLYGPDSTRPDSRGFGVEVVDREAKQIVEETATLWLQKQGMVMVEGSTRDAIRTEQAFILTNNERIRVGRMSGADVLVYRTYSRPLATVTVKGISVETGEVLWTGVASTAPHGDPATVNKPVWQFDWGNGVFLRVDPEKEAWTRLANTQVLRALTCQAFATAFQMQSTGKRTVAPEKACQLPER